MTGLERCVAAVKFQKPDRFPVLPVLLMQGAKELNLPLERYFSKGEFIARGQLRLLDKFGHDGVLGFPHVVEDVLPFGAGLRYFDDGPPSVDRMCIRKFEEISQMVVPEPGNHPQLKQTLQAIEMLAREVKGKKLIVGAVIGPFSLPSMLMGTEKYMRLLFGDPEAFRRYFSRLMEICSEFSARWANMQLQAGADLIVVADGIGSGTILRRHECQELALPVNIKFFKQINGLIGYEFVGDAEPIIDLYKNQGPAVFLVGSSDSMVFCRKKLGKTAALMGNINNIKLLRWAPERVEFEIKKMLQPHSLSDGIIVSNQGPEIPYHVPEENIRAMVKAVEKFSKEKIQASFISSATALAAASA